MAITCSHQRKLTVAYLLAPYALFLVLLSLSSSQAQKILLTTTPSAVQWTCFELPVESIDTCCQLILQASELATVPPPDLAYCSSQLAVLPRTLWETLKIGKQYVAQYSLILEVVDSEHLSDNVRQYLWNVRNESQKLLESDAVFFPFLLLPLEVSDRVSIHSTLSLSGGMHRLLYHEIQRLDSGNTCYMFLSIPNAIFMDLDDAFEGYDKEQFHTAGVCDIEQPAFVSGQHVIVLEIDTRHTSHLQFASKIHLRYPYPSPTYQQRIFLPEPQLLCEARDGSLQATQKQQSLEHIWVAAGSEEDYDLVMWTTVVVCLVGVIWMMADISYVARWDQ